jgi:hypothetical protein
MKLKASPYLATFPRFVAVADQVMRNDRCFTVCQLTKRRLVDPIADEKRPPAPDNDRRGMQDDGFGTFLDLRIRQGLT